MARCSCNPVPNLRSRLALSLGIEFSVGVGLFELHSTACDSVSNVRDHGIVEVLELVNGVLWVAFVAFAHYRFVIGRIGVAAARVWALVEVPAGFGALWFGAHLAGTTVLFVVIRGLVILYEFWELGVVV